MRFRADFAREAADGRENLGGKSEHPHLNWLFNVSSRKVAAARWVLNEQLQSAQPIQRNPILGVQRLSGQLEELALRIRQRQ